MNTVSDVSMSPNLVLCRAAQAALDRIVTAHHNEVSELKERIRGLEERIGAMEAVRPLCVVGHGRRDLKRLLPDQDENGNDIKRMKTIE